MPVQSMHCVRCGGEASEYAPNKWQCLNCQAKFVYEPPPKEVLVKQTIEQKIDLADEGVIYTCDRCGGCLSKMVAPERVCEKCGDTVCPTCFGQEGDGPSEKKKRRQKSPLCLKCYIDREKAEMAKPLFLVAFVVFVGLALFGDGSTGDVLRSGLSLVTFVVVFVGAIMARRYRRRRDGRTK